MIYSNVHVSTWAHKCKSHARGKLHSANNYRWPTYSPISSVKQQCTLCSILVHIYIYWYSYSNELMNEIKQQLDWNILHIVYHTLPVLTCYYCCKYQGAKCSLSLLAVPVEEFLCQWWQQKLQLVFHGSLQCPATEPCQPSNLKQWEVYTCLLFCCWISWN